MSLAHDVRQSHWEGRAVAEWRVAWDLPDLVVLDSTGSTNDVARTLAERGAPAGTTVVADAQLAGRGQKGRPWVAPAGKALLLSVVLRTAGEAADPGTVPIRVGLAACAAIERTSGIRPQIKWPNDLVVAAGPHAPHDRKVAGVLCEGATGPSGAFVVAGIGINVLQDDEDWPPDLRERAASLAALTARPIARATLAGALLDALRPFRVTGEPLDPATRERFHQVDALYGREVSVDGEYAGTAHGIGADGALIVRRGDERRTIRSGTVRTLAPPT